MAKRRGQRYHMRIGNAQLGELERLHNRQKLWNNRQKIKASNQALKTKCYELVAKGKERKAFEHIEREFDKAITQQIVREQHLITFGRNKQIATIGNYISKHNPIELLLQKGKIRIGT